MALSATIDQFVVRGYGQIIYSYSFGDAVRDGLVPCFDMINVAVPLTAGERVNYDELTKKNWRPDRTRKIDFLSMSFAVL